MRPRTRTTIAPCLCLVGLLALALGCHGREPGPPLQSVAPLESYAGRQSACVPDFPDQNGWYGGDAAYSIPLPQENGRVSLWLFGDSFVARPGSRAGRRYPFVHNTIGLSHCAEDGTWRLETFWQRDPNGSPHAFFSPSRESGWVRRARENSHAAYYWPFDGFIAHDTLFVGLLRVVASPPRGPFNLPFRLAGMDLARIENFREKPVEWKIQLSTLSTSTVAFPGSAFVETPSHLYAFAFFDRGDQKTPRMLSRLKTDALLAWQADLSREFETWTNDSRWVSGFEPESAMILMDDDSSEMSVHFDRESETWLAVYVDPIRGRANREPDFVRIRRAKELTGPWSESETLFAIPETTNRNDLSESDIVGEGLFCYAGKAHPQFSSPDKIVATYVCNLYSRSQNEDLRVLERLLENKEIYRPRAISVERLRERD